MSRNVLIGIIIALVVLLLVIGFLLWERHHDNKYVNSFDNPTISGTFDINGVVPDGASVNILNKPMRGNGQPQTVASGLAAHDGGSWTFGGVESGQSYEITAQLMVDGEVVTSSSPLTVTAPATEEVLTLNVPSETASQTPATISGTVRVNGYIPQGATITLQGRASNAQPFENVVNNLPGTRSQVVSYTNAISGQSYEVVGKLFDASGNSIGTSSMLVVTAPASNELLTINSQATPPAAPTVAPGTPTPTGAPSGGSVISGTINFNGAAPANSRIVIFQRVHGTSNFQVAINNVTPLNGTTWQWNGATSGTWYDMVAILKQAQSNGTDQDIADSNTITVAAPGSGQTFTINSNVSLPAPTGSMSIVCGNLNQGANTYNAVVSFQAVQNAQTYWYQIGTSNGGSELLSQTQGSNGNPQQGVNAVFNRGTNYYARYAYSEVANTPAGSQNFSSFSNTQQFVCN